MEIKSMKCAGSWLKYLIFLFNLVFVLCGALLVVWGAFIIKDVGALPDFDVALTLPIIAIFLGTSIFIVSIIGCIGAITENVCFTVTYAGFLLLVTIAQIALVVSMFINRTEFINNMTELVKHAAQLDGPFHGYPMEKIEIHFQCCGLKSYDDYKNNVPKSCCGYTRQSTNNCTREIYVTRNGCYASFKRFWQINTNLVRWVGIFIAVVELLVLWAAITLALKVRGKYLV